jgi:hypothetical protein
MDANIFKILQEPLQEQTRKNCVACTCTARRRSSNDTWLNAGTVSHQTINPLYRFAASDVQYNTLLVDNARSHTNRVRC